MQLGKVIREVVYRTGMTSGDAGGAGFDAYERCLEYRQSIGPRGQVERLTEVGLAGADHGIGFQQGVRVLLDDGDWKECGQRVENFGARQ